MEPSTLKTQADEMVDRVGGISSEATEHAKRSVEEARAGLEELTARGSTALRESTQRAREALSRTTDQAAQYVQEQPLKALLMATVAGAAIAMVAGGLKRHRHD